MHNGAYVSCCQSVTYKPWEVLFHHSLCSVLYMYPFSCSCFSTKILVPKHKSSGKVFCTSCYSPPFFFPCFNPTFPELRKTASKSSGPITPFLRTINEIQLSEPNLRLLTSNHTTASEKSPWMRFSCFLSNQPYEPLWAIKSAYYLHSPTSCRRVVPLQNLLLLLLNNVDSRSSQPFIH